MGLLKISKIFFSAILLTLSLSLQAKSYLPWHIGKVAINYQEEIVKIRAGFLHENSAVPFKGNIIYYQGLGDSMLNHDPLFEVLINDGYRVISFDYFGQGGSEGSMNDTTIEGIQELGLQVLELFSRDDGPDGDSYHIIGWSTGGLAAYEQAYQSAGENVLSVTLLAPGIAPNIFVGEGLFNWPPNEITMRTLTSNKFVNVNNPHEDPISPKSPASVLSFAFDLLVKAFKSRSWEMNSKVRGFVLLSDPNQDNYVNSEKTLNVIKENAPNFSCKIYSNTKHEIDNEQEKIAVEARKNILSFINNNYSEKCTASF